MAFKSNTEDLVDKITFEWTIHNFSYCREETGEFLTSPTFSSPTNDQLQWCLQLYPKGLNEMWKDHLSLFVRLISGTGTGVRAMLTFSILAKGEKKFEMLCQNAQKFSRDAQSMVYVKFVKRDILFGERQLLFPDDKLVIFCEMCVLTGSVDCIPSIPDCSLSNDLGSLLEDDQLSDVTLSTPSKEFKAHKAILAARSPVFAAIFRHEMEENRRINIDIDGEVLEEVLRYMYTGNAPNLDKMADKLLIASSKYGLKWLKALCEKSLRDNLGVGNAADALLIAHLNGSEELKKRVSAIIMRRIEEVKKIAE